MITNIENLNKDYPVSKVCVELRLFSVDSNNFMDIVNPGNKLRLTLGRETIMIPATAHVTCVNSDKNTSIYLITQEIKLDAPGKYHSYRTITYYDDILKIIKTNEHIVSHLTVK